MKQMITRLSFGLVYCALLASCAAPADPTAMVPASVSISKKFNKSVLLGVTGGEETNKMAASAVSNQDFAAALQSTIEQHQVFSRVIRSGNADYRLDVRLIELRRPMFGFNMTVTADVSWRVREVQSDRIVWQKNIKRPYTAAVSEAFVGIKRLRLANEGAIRENIKAGLEEISRLSL